MHAQRWLSVVPWSGAAIALLFGMAARDCILLASAAMLAIYTARTQAETREAVDLFRGAIQCWVIGGASLLVAILLVAMVAGTHVSLWDGNGLDTQSMVSVLGLCVVIVGVTVAATVAPARRFVEFAGFIVVAVAMVWAAFTARTLDASGPCIFALSVAAIAATSGWKLARGVGSDLARAAIRI